MDNKTNKLIPGLRFPEFVNEWEEKTLDEVATILKGKGISKSDVVENGNLPCIRYGELYTHYHETIIEINSYTNLKADDLILSQANDVIIPASGETQIDIATASCVLKNGVALGGDLNIIRTKVNGVFLSYYLNNAKRKDIAQLAQGISVVHLYPNQLKTLVLNIPNPAEQQKIASCLSSLDEVITAHRKKLDVLKEHKKGLMQNLFPQEGETVPKWRFPEFKKDGEWHQNDFSRYIKLYRGSSPRPIQEYLTQANTGVNWIKIGDTKNAVNYVINRVEEKITLKGSENSRKVKKGELILANSMSFGKTYELGIEGCIYDAWFVLREYEKHFDKSFLLQLLNSDYMQRQYQRLSAGGIVQNISSEIVYKTILLHTSLQEQQKIASFLYSLDALIMAHAGKIEQLKLHKKGLIQGLFPKVIDQNL